MSTVFTETLFKHEYACPALSPMNFLHTHLFLVKAIKKCNGKYFLSFFFPIGCLNICKDVLEVGNNCLRAAGLVT